MTITSFPIPTKALPSLTIGDGALPLTNGGLGGDQSAATANSVPVYPGSSGAAVPATLASIFASPPSIGGTAPGTGNFTSTTVTGLVATPTNATLNAGVTVNQQPAGTVSSGISGTPYFYNGVNITNLNVTDTTGQLLVTGLGAFLQVNGANAHTPNGTFAVLGQVFVGTQSNTANDPYIGVAGVAIAKTSNAKLGWSITGLNGNASIDPNITGAAGIYGAEFDTSVLSGATVGEKYGAAIVLGGADAVSATGYDAGLSFYNSPGTTPGWKYGISFNAARASQKVLATTGTVMGLIGSQTVANGIDLSPATITGNAWSSPGAKITGTGAASFGSTNTPIVAQTDTNGPAYVTVINNSAGASAASGVQFKTVTANSNILFSLFDQSGTPNGYYDTGSAVTAINHRMNGVNIFVETKGGGIQIGAPTGADKGVGALNISAAYYVNGSQVVGARDTGWTAMTGSPDKATAYATSSVTLAQLAGRVAELQAILTAHGLIGP